MTSKNSEAESTRFLCYAFLVLCLGTSIFMVYLAVDHHMEWKNLQHKIDLMEMHLPEIERRHSAQTMGEEASKVIKKIVERRRSCDKEYAVLNLMKNRKRDMENPNEGITMWNTVPYPFMHLNASANFGTAPDPKNVDGMHTVTGWQVMNVDKCPDINPKLENNNLIVPMDGNYYVYSEVTFKCGSINDQRPPSIHRHVVQFIETRASYHDRPFILMESSYQLCGKDEGDTKKSSQQAGVYRFSEGDILRVLVQKHEETKLHADSNADAFFGVYLL